MPRPTTALISRSRSLATGRRISCSWRKAASHVELAWEIPAYDRVFRRLASFSRLIRFDMRGSGLSDPLGLFRAALARRTGEGHAGGARRGGRRAGGRGGEQRVGIAGDLLRRFVPEPDLRRSCSTAATRDWPERPTTPGACRRRSSTRPSLVTVAGGGNVEHALRYVAPNAMKDPAFVAQWQRRGRSTSCGPAAVMKLAEMLVFSDVRPLLTAVQAPTLVLYRRGDRYAGKPHAVYLAEHIAGAKLVELPGEDNLIFVGNSDADLDEIEEFLTGARHAAADRPGPRDGAVHGHRRVHRTPGGVGRPEVARPPRRS